MILQKKLIIPAWILFAASILISCKKTQDSAANASTVDSTIIKQKIEDTTLLISKDFYLWYSQIPTTFNPQNYADPSEIMVALRNYSNEPGYSSPVDKWSFGIKKTDWNQLSGGIGSATNIASSNGDFGLSVFFKVGGDLRVKLVERESPAGLAGIHRGWRITKINGNSDITTSNATFIVNNVYYSNNSTFTFLKPDGSTVDITLSADLYTQQPLYLDTVYNEGSKTIGYMVFNSFLGDTTSIFNNFARVMNYFSAQNVTDLVIDLRYNGGGYVAVQEKLADYLAPTSANGSLMMTETFNDKHQNYNTSLHFNKIGPLNPNHILFIVSQSTASASELLINNLKPYMDVKLIGPYSTAGKPVGFFPISVGDWYVFPISFRSLNSAGTGNYFNGLQIDSPVADGLDKDWGDTSEASLAKAIKYITTGSFGRQLPDTYAQAPSVISGNKILDKPTFKGSVDTRGLQ
ncbi:MAG: S41 family peptidase [Bacteroidota bacterium]|nr:S41 family peptidase [Bacteroidota bacterium]